LATQVRLLRVLETGEYMRVGSSKMQKTNVRLVAATNVSIPDAITKGKFREDLYYRLNTVPITVPPLRARQDDILLLFKKFSIDFSQKYNMPPIVLSKTAEDKVMRYSFPGNVRQLKNLVEQISIIESERNITPAILDRYIPEQVTSLSISTPKPTGGNYDGLFERELIFKFLSEMQKDISDLKNKLAEMADNKPKILDKKPLILDTNSENKVLIGENYSDEPIEVAEYVDEPQDDSNTVVDAEVLSLHEKEKELMQKALTKHEGNRRYAAHELGISERTLYRKLKEFGLI